MRRLMNRLTSYLTPRLGAVFIALLGGSLARLTMQMTRSLRHGLAIAAVGIFIGVVVAYAALASFGAVELLLAVWRPESDLLTVGFRGLHLNWLLIPALAGLAIGGLLSWLAPQPPVELADVIHAAHKPDPQVSRTGGYISLLKSVLALGGGSPTGLYGPLVVLGASLAASMKRFTRLSPHFGEMALGAGVAAAISAAFSAPLAGILFAHEVVLRHYSLRFFAPVTLASASAYVFSGEGLNQHIVMLPILPTRMAGPSDIFLLLVLGVMAGLLAVFLMRGLERLRKAMTALPLPLWARPVLAGLAVGILAHIAPGIMGPGLDVISAMLDGTISATGLMTLLVLKALAAGLCLTLYFHGGIVAPALFVGAALGGLAAAAFALLTPLTGYTPDSGLFVLAGMAAMASSILGAPLAVILLGFELSQNYAATTAIMVTIVTANLLTSRLYARSVFEPQLLARGVDLSLGRENLALQATPVTHLMAPDFVTLDDTMSVEAAVAEMARAQCAEAHVLDADKNWVGKLCLYALVNRSDSATLKAKDFIETAPLVLQASQNALQAQQAMTDFIGEAVPVLDDAKLVGIVHEADLFAHARMVTRSIWQHDHDDDVRDKSAFGFDGARKN
ncbi:MAG: chloride channel protein [Alphaproteobacteria bacterium]|nr:chloride channel protein [Alphaproteobacteria bacterium]